MIDFKEKRKIPKELEDQLDNPLVQWSINLTYKEPLRRELAQTIYDKMIDEYNQENLINNTEDYTKILKQIFRKKFSYLENKNIKKRVIFDSEFVMNNRESITNEKNKKKKINWEKFEYFLRKKVSIEMKKYFIKKSLNCSYYSFTSLFSIWSQKPINKKNEIHFVEKCINVLDLFSPFDKRFSSE